MRVYFNIWSHFGFCTVHNGADDADADHSCAHNSGAHNSGAKHMHDRVCVCNC